MHPSGQIYIARHVVFDESSFPYSSDSAFAYNKSNSCQNLSFTPHQVYHPSTLPLFLTSDDNNTHNPNSASSTSNSPHHSVSPNHNNNSNLLSQTKTLPITNTEPNIELHTSLSVKPITTNRPPIFQASPETDQNTSAPENTQQSKTPLNTHPMTTRSKIGIFKPKLYNVALVHKEPESVEEVVQNPKWFEVIKKEYSALVKNNTWSLVTRSDG